MKWLLNNLDAISKKHRITLFKLIKKITKLWKKKLFFYRIYLALNMRWILGLDGEGSIVYIGMNENLVDAFDDKCTARIEIIKLIWLWLNVDDESSTDITTNYRDFMWYFCINIRKH